jgi:hypothetical protein
MLVKVRHSISIVCKRIEKALLTSVDLFLNGSLLPTFVHLRDGLHPSYWTSDVAIRIHDLLKGVILPAKDVVAVVAKPETIGNVLADSNILLMS